MAVVITNTFVIYAHDISWFVELNKTNVHMKEAANI
jgi:hypothetical protein